MRMVTIAIVRFEFKTIKFEFYEILRRFKFVLDDEPCHGSTTTFGINCDRLQFAVFHHKKLRLNDRHLF